MSSFTNPLTVTKIGARKWRLERFFVYYIGDDKGDNILVPGGFETDFASVPRIFWSLIPPDGSYTQAAVLHDFCYFKKLYTRKKCDEIFLEAMTVLKVNRIKRYVMFWAVRGFAWYGWNLHRNREKI